MQTRLLIAAVLFLEILLGISPKADHLTWVLENAPVWIGLGILAFTWPKFRLTHFCLALLAIHAVILMIGGHYTYAKVPLGEWAKNAFQLQRNPYDRLGHFAQGFIPAILVRELLLRKARFERNFWLPFLTVSVCLAFSAFYELIEWWTAVLTGEAATDFLGTQGDIWDTQWDMFLALAGAVCSLVFLSARHDRSLARIK
jgi:putative membrane protein